MIVAATDAKSIVDVLHARNRIDHLLDHVLRVAVAHRTVQRHLAAAHLDADIAAIVLVGGIHPLGDVLLQALVGAFVSLGAAPHAPALARAEAGRAAAT